MANWTKQDIFDIITEYLEQYGSAIGSSKVRELTEAELTNEMLEKLSIPSELPDTEEWVQTSLNNMMKPIRDGVSDLDTIKTETIAAKDSANAAAAAAEGAENVDAELEGMTVTITNRQGTPRSVNIGFEIYNTYSSVAAMNADAANVPTGKFVMIATNDPTSAENARLYGRNSNPPTSQNPFTFLSDLDQASAAAWADWLNNMKPEINGRIATADADHVIAQSDHSTATTDHSVATADHTQALSDHSTASADHTQAVSDHSTALADHTQAETDHTRSESDHTRAESDHTTAASDHSQALSDHTRAESDHTTATTDHYTASADHQQATEDHAASVAATNAANTEANRAKGYNDNPWEIRNDGYIWVWNESTQQMVRTNKMIIDFEDLTPEQQAEMIRMFYESLTIASVETCEAIITELT